MWGKTQFLKTSAFNPNMSSQLRKIATHKDVYPAIAKESYNPSDFKDQVIIVTGSGSGIGKATALAFAEMGSRVAFTDLALGTAQAAAKEAEEKFGVKTIATKGDVRNVNDMKHLVEETREKLGPIDCVVFAAGYGMFDTFDVSREEDWWGLIETNLKGPTDLTRLVIKDMIKRNTGTLIYISSRVPSSSSSSSSFFPFKLPPLG
jgi:NADP-dependent 3-hydroxy acid dehydrogenase YdfG